MKPLTRLLILLSAPHCFYSCSDNDTKSKEVTEIRQPEYADNGRTIDSLKKFYNCESIEYDNWKENDETDSCLTVCLINSNKVPLAGNPDSSSNQLIGIALTIKNSLAKPENYSSFNIIFVKKDKLNGEDVRVHSAGIKISSKDL